MNKERFDEIFHYIRKHRWKWDQKFWHNKHWFCGTTHCVAGFAELRALGLEFNITMDKLKRVPMEYMSWSSGAIKNRAFTRDRAEFHLELTHEEAEWLFSHKRTFRDLKNVYQHGIEQAMNMPRP